MSKRSGTWRVVGVILGVMVVAALGFVLAVLLFAPGTLYMAGSTAQDSSGVSYPYSVSEQKSAGADQSVAPMEELAAPSAAPEAAREADGTSVDSMVIRSANMEVRVEEVAPAVEQVRVAAKRNGGEITSLTVHSGTDGVRPLEQGADSELYLSPATAYLTIRVPADQLDDLETDVAKTGTVVSQSASADDVTEQYVDLSARLKNLKAEEARLRTFFDEAQDVEDLLAVQSELARVRGEIEAMQAQVDYLERQVAKATLTVMLTESGPIVRPGDADWGFVDAITRGIQAAVALINWVIVAAIALLPILLVALLVFLGVRAVRKRRSATTDEGPVAAAEDDAEGDSTPAPQSESQE